MTSAVDAEHSYALYLPSSFTPDRSWPVLYLFEARRRGAEIVRHHQAAAEALGWIVLGSNQAESDGEFEPNRRAMIAMWEDSHARFPIDPRRRYAGGFSGGARIAALLGYVRAGELAGVIGWGAGLPPTERPVEQRPPFALFSAIGDADYNFLELWDLAAELRAVGARFRLRRFEGAHQWPPPEVAAEALQWMEIEAMRSGRRPLDRELIADAFEARVARASRLDAAGRPLEAAMELRAVARDFAGLHTVAEVEAEAEAIEGDDRWSAAAAEQAAAFAWERATFDRIKTAFNATAAAAPIPLGLEEVLAMVDLEALRMRAESERRPEALAARRMLARLRAQTGFLLPRLFAGQGDPGRGVLMLEIATRLDPASTGLQLDLARMAMAADDADTALRALAAVAALGALDAAVLDEATWLPLRDDPRFRRLRSAGAPPDG